MSISAAELAIESAGGVIALARKIGAHRTQVHNWRYRGIPAKWALKVADATGISPEVLRPDVFRR